VALQSHFSRGGRRVVAAPLERTSTPGVYARASRWVAVYLEDGRQRRPSAPTFRAARETKIPAAAREASPRSRAHLHSCALYVHQLAGATAAFVAACGAYGYATRRDLSSWARTLFWALLGLIAFGIVAIFVSIPNGHIIYAVAGLGIFGAFTIFDFNRLRRARPDSAVAIAASIFLDISNIFLLLLELFGGQRD
jgi:inhibitor of apoptosis-promoting Bax1